MASKANNKAITPKEYYLPHLKHDDDIRSVTQFLRLIGVDGIGTNFFNHRNFIAYRGQAGDWPLIPSAYRGEQHNPQGFNVSNSHALSIEQEIYREFRDRARGYSTNLNLDDPWEVMCFAQHFDVPTRLLDWTTNPLIALYFALSWPSSDDYAVVWCLNVTQFMPKLGNYSDEIRMIYRDNNRGLILSDLASETAEFSRLLSANQPQRKGIKIADQLIVIQPPDIDHRVRNQGSLFSVYIPSKESPRFVVDHGIYIDASTQGNQALLKFKIPNGYRGSMLDELWNMGITAYQIYPDLQGLGKYMKEKQARRIRRSISEPRYP